MRSSIANANLICKERPKSSKCFLVVANIDSDPMLRSLLDICDHLLRMQILNVKKQKDLKVQNCFSVVANLDSDPMLRSLLEICDPNIRDRNGCTALHFAAQLGKESAVSLLLVNNSSFCCRKAFLVQF